MSRSITVHVGRTGSALDRVALNGGRTVQDALDAAEINLKDSESVMVNNEEADLDDELEQGDEVVLVRNIEGGAN